MIYTLKNLFQKKNTSLETKEQSDSDPLRIIGNQKFIFIHINKTAGTSINRHIGIKMEQHYSVKNVLDITGPEIWKDAFTFSVVRNPWDRAVSQYKYRYQQNRNNMATDQISFEKWAELVFGEIKNRTYRNEDRLFGPQINWLKNYEEKIDIDFIARFETLAKDFHQIANRIGVNPTLPHLNKTATTNYKDFYSHSTKKLIEEAFVEDIEYFKYSF